MTEIDLAETVYIEQRVPDYCGNPFIEALPPIWLAAQSVRKLTVTPGFHPNERELESDYRIHCVRRLFRHFQPLDTHLDIEQRISIAIRQGYVTRNPVMPEHVRRLTYGYEAVQEKNIGVYGNFPTKSTSAGFTMIGMSGVGKTTAVERILSLYPQCIEHSYYKNEPFFIKQLVWLKIDCPFTAH